MFLTTRSAYGPNLLARLLTASSAQQIDEYAKAAWILNGEGLIDDAAMEYLAPVIEHQRHVNGAGGRSRQRTAHSTVVHRRPAVPQQFRARSLLRRRMLAKNGIIPTCIAKLFTVSKLAVLAIIAQEVLQKHSCNMSLPEIAARAGVGCTTARYAIREAAQLGLISVRENRRNATWNWPNTIRVICHRWCRWLDNRRKQTPEKKRGNLSSGIPSTPLRNVSPTNVTNRINRFESHLKRSGDGGTLRKLADPP